MSLHRFAKSIGLNSLPFGYVLLLLVSLILSDGVFTEFVINSGMGWESNPFMSGLLSTGHFMLVKITGSLLVALLLVNIYRHQPKMAAVASWLFVLFYTGVVYWNLGSVLIAANFSR